MHTDAMHVYHWAMQNMNETPNRIFYLPVVRNRAPLELFCGSLIREAKDVITVQK